MPREKVIRDSDREFHEYSREELDLLTRLRNKTCSLLKILDRNGIKAFVHGSIARGDVTTTSDIDIHVPYLLPSFRLELINELFYTQRRIIMGTPNSTIKGLLTLDEDQSISFPLTMPTEREIEFYRFSGLVYYEDLQNNISVSGVTKQLLLIEPIETGYWSSSVLANKKLVMQKLNISQRIVDERIRVLERRDKVGRTGKILDHVVSPDENFEQALNQIASKNPIVRNQMKKSKTVM